MNKPIIGISMGDPAGIGPEIVLKALMNEDLYKEVDCLVIGDQAILKDIIQRYDLPIKINALNQVSDLISKKGVVNVLDLDMIDMYHFKLGQVSPMCGKAAYAYIEKSIDLALTGHIDAIATAPINKGSLKAAKINYIGHTEILADLTNTKDPLTMFQIDNLRVFFLSRHVALSQAISLVRKDRLKDYIERSINALKTLGIEGQFAVAGLNPHAGENGLFGNEETNEIIPAIQDMKEKGFDVTGPIPADSIFALALKGSWSGVLSLYHDQGHIATKTYNFYRTISLTLGLPFLRTSVDHGTAMEIAGKNQANPLSMIEAIKIAGRYISEKKS